jgi:hypothetical protein
VLLGLCPPDQESFLVDCGVHLIVSPSSPPYDDRMRNRKGNARDVWVMVDHDGHRTLYQLLEVGKGGDAVRLARELHAPAVAVELALPALPALDEMSEGGRRLGNSRLILLNVRTATGTDAKSTGVRRFVRQPSKPVPMAASSDRSE